MGRCPANLVRRGGLNTSRKRGLHVDTIEIWSGGAFQRLTSLIIMKGKWVYWNILYI